MVFILVKNSFSPKYVVTAVLRSPHEMLRYRLLVLSHYNTLEIDSPFVNFDYLTIFSSDNFPLTLFCFFPLPPFPPPIWSVYERTLGSEPRTTNFLEGWHRHISSILGQAHPNIWKFLEFLKGEQSNTELRKQALLRGESLSKKSSKAVSREKRLQKIVTEFQMKTNNGHTCMAYLEGLAHKITY